MVSIALAFAVLGLGGSASEVGIVLAARTLPMVGSVLIGSVVADRISRQRVMVAADLARTVTIRGEPHTVQQAVVRGLTHAAYHVGQILYVARLVNPAAPWLTIAPGASGVHRAGYRRQP